MARPPLRQRYQMATGDLNAPLRPVDRGSSRNPGYKRGGHVKHHKGRRK